MEAMHQFLEAVEAARRDFIQAASGLSHAQAHFKPAPDQWSIAEIAEHLVWAERAGVMGIWKALEGIKSGQPIWMGENSNQGLTIEQVIAKTWAEKEQVPAIAAPNWGGPLAFWLASLAACAQTLQQLRDSLQGMDPASIIYPHPISGPLNVKQRMAFLRFHLQRHQGQLERVKVHPQFPSH